MNKIFKIFLLFLPFILAFLFSCEKEKFSDIDNFDYFPLQIGNKWVYSYSTEEVKGLKTIDGIEYFEMLVKNYVADKISRSYNQYYRKTADGKVFTIYGDLNNEYLIYDFRVPLNYTWTYNVENDLVRTVKNVADYKDITINGILLDSCRQFDYDILQAFDDEYTVILAPGLGRLISHSYAWGSGDTLKSAIIDGKFYSIK